ncbi:hypothetical protein MUK70_16975 [Dyadobacter chenwenxiniae]|uniref:Uncharacterized protein n=1 Tax=Dyadobacter chenwenxiniae TaxID=2906456 RepID=A0A9X1PK01_9BACT|nr:hypothetical protein [Dyadobacter chenwenxiniae]MCF0053338.1 hypothetical protein [Dyadobacter chenwenxiniae]MCF0060933.1 hypothetical protein [Dyadobacter chenwenxiniae]UON80761.1 hypothetical protein MUK70_16975 [Dyadobacter chenwenxiniae]
MTTEEKKMDIIGKIISTEDETLIDMVNNLLNASDQDSNLRKPGWGKGMVGRISDDFNDFIPPGFPQ